jgi:NADH:ubiquinone oxidoreductase subunit 2 (subunit N)
MGVRYFAVMTCLVASALCLWQSRNDSWYFSFCVACLCVTCTVVLFATWSNGVERVYRRRIAVASSSLAAVYVAAVIAAVLFWDETNGSNEEWSPMDSKVITGPLLVVSAIGAFLSAYGLHCLMRISATVSRSYKDESDER